MSPRVSGTSVSINDVRVLAEAAGVDLDQPLRAQLDGGQQTDGLAAQIAELSAKVDALAEGIAPPAGSAPVNASEAQARALASKLAESQSQWFSTGSSDGS